MPSLMGLCILAGLARRYVLVVLVSQKDVNILAVDTPT